jgi:hypothetical protein
MKAIFAAACLACAAAAWGVEDVARSRRQAPSPRSGIGVKP